MPKSVIYETKGRAREFAELAINLYDFCSHACVYCYSPDVIHKNRTDFTMGQYPRVTALDVLASAKKQVAKGDLRRVLLSFLCDPYQPIEQETQLTRKCIMALHEAGLNVIILTKGGLRSIRDFDLLTPKDAYATTLTCLSASDSKKWEPNAALPSERVKALIEAHERGIETWVSLEPVIYPEDAMEFVRLLHKVTGHYKIGVFNYSNRLPPEMRGQVQGINWNEFGWQIKELCDKLGAKYYLKFDLLKKMGIPPADFKQTWICH